MVKKTALVETSDRPKYVQLAEELRQLIAQGEFRVGDRLPSYAEMYRRFGVATATAQGVFDLLQKEGLIERRPGSGIYVTEPQRRRSGSIGFVGSFCYNTPKAPFHQKMMEGMQQAAAQYRQHLLYLGSDADWDTAFCEKIDGLVLCNIEEPEPILQQLPPGFPVVSILTIVDGITSVGVDDYRSSQLVVQCLLDRGHSHIACLMEETPSEARRRYSGYRDALLQAGIAVDPGWSRLTPLVDREALGRPPYPYRDWARAHMLEWLQSGWRDLNCTAILVQNEMAAIGVMQVLQEEGLRVPDDVSVVCFDGTEVSDLVTPSLSSIALPLVEIGARAVEIVNRQIQGENTATEAVMLPLNLQLKQSIGPAHPSPATAHTTDVKVLTP